MYITRYVDLRHFDGYYQFKLEVFLQNILFTPSLYSKVTCKIICKVLKTIIFLKLTSLNLTNEPASCDLHISVPYTLCFGG